MPEAVTRSARSARGWSPAWARGWALAPWLLLLLAANAHAQAPSATDMGYAEGRIVEIVQRTGQDLVALVQLGDGTVVDAVIPPDDPYGDISLPPYRVGERVELYFAPGPDGRQMVVVTDWVRRPALGWLVALFAVVSFAVAGFKGLRAFVSTAASLAIVITFIVPQILAGANPVLISLLGVGGILILAIYFVHGVTWSTSAALAGTLLAVVATMVLALVFTDLARLTGLGNEDAILLMSAAPQVALKGLLLAGLLIGALGALTDITIVQASVVRELAHTDPSLGLRVLYAKGMNVGRDHVGSLVNTLVLAYTGASLSLLILLNVGEFGVMRAFNLELVANEVVHTLVGSIGLVLAVPITTLLAALLFRGDRIPVAPGELSHAHHHH
ncbi:MAG: YibE/F family protein [Trueperaceae bacterium]|nr:MAG: YibE/F family protein [Trueperaceae bacterium]